MLQKVVICGVDTSGLPKLTAKENEELIAKLKAGDEAAREKFIVGNMRLVLSLVKRFWAKNANADDVFQAGCVGLIKAIDNFDPSFQVKFSTYAVPPVLVLRNSQKELKMTRNQALLSVFALFEGKNEHQAEINKLKEIASVMPFTEWDDATLIDAIEHFMAENGRVPTVTDFKKENGLPANPVIRQRYKMNLREWLDKNFPTYYKPDTTRKQALQFAYELSTGEVQAKIKELLEEYPVCRWTLENIKDGVEEIYRVSGRLAYECEFKKENNLPDYGHLLYKYHCGLRKWYDTYCHELYEKSNFIFVNPKRNYLQEFIEEYERIKPYTKEDFDKKRNPQKSCGAQVIMQNSNVDEWKKLLQVCNLPIYKKEKKEIITEIEVVVLDENLEELYSYVV